METTHMEKRSGSGLLKVFFVWPVKAAWKFATLVEKSIGILLSLLLAAALLLIGMYLASTFFGLIIGLPMMAAGAILLLRALY